MKMSLDSEKVHANKSYSPWKFAGFAILQNFLVTICSNDELMMSIRVMSSSFCAKQIGVHEYKHGQKFASF